jgi:hypothetical protein
MTSRERRQEVQPAGKAEEKPSALEARDRQEAAEALKMKMKQHKHICFKCDIEFLCRGKQCDGKGPKAEILCIWCWESMSE